jgi:hypothetical protein
MEKWVDIEGFEGFYQVSDLGRVRSVDRVVVGRFGDYKAKGRVLAQKDNGYGYLRVVLAKNGRMSNKYVHRLVASTFIGNPLNLEEVNHKDENKSNNKADNLEWCTSSYNINYGERSKKAVETKNRRKSIGAERAVLKLSKNGDVLEEYKSVKSAAQKNGVFRANINKCCNGQYSQTGGFMWKFKDI